MSRPSKRVPAYLLHRPSGKARVRIKGRDFYLGDFGSEQSRRRYGELIAEHCGGRVVDPLAPSPTGNDPGPSVAEVVLAFITFGEKHYVKDGKQTSQLHAVKSAVGPLVDLYGLTPAKEFGPLALKAVRTAMVERGWLRKTINDHCGRIRRVFRYSVENELIPSYVLERLKAVAPLLRDRTEAPEAEPVRPVAEADIEAVLPLVSRQIRDMIRLQLLCGCRPEEICALRPCDLKREGEAWEFIPQSHKTQHHGKERRIYFGPRAKVILRPYLKNRPAERFCFSPIEAESMRAENKRKKRKSKVQPSQLKRAEESAARKRKRPPASNYSTASYRRAIRRACEKAGISPWAPNRLRHSRATDIRRKFGIEAAKVVCGHSQLQTTEIYAELDFEKARAIMADVG